MEPQSVGVVALGDGEPVGKDEVQLEQVDRSRGVDLDLRLDLVSLDEPVLSEREEDAHPGAPLEEQTRPRR